MVRKLVLAVCAACMLTVCASGATVSAQEYSTEYPNVYNSGSPYWIECTIEGMGDFVIVLDPNTHPQSFGFDGPTGYNLINNTGSVISGRAYDLNSSAGYNARWHSFYKLQLQNGATSYGQATWVDYNITDIRGTTLDLVDYHGERGNDNLTENERRAGYEYAQTLTIAIIGLCMLIRPIFKFTYRNRGGGRDGG